MSCPPVPHFRYYKVIVIDMQRNIHALLNANAFQCLVDCNSFIRTFGDVIFLKLN